MSIMDSTSIAGSVELSQTRRSDGLAVSFITIANEATFMRSAELGRCELLNIALWAVKASKKDEKMHGDDNTFRINFFLQHLKHELASCEIHTQGATNE